MKTLNLFFCSPTVQAGEGGQFVFIRAQAQFISRLVLVLWMLIGASAFASPAANREAQWKAVDDAIAKGLPQTAITNLLPIISAALREKAYPEAVKAIAKKIALQGSIQGNKPEERITRLEAEIPKLPKEVAPVLQALLADWYWQYFQQNKWRFMQRTATSEAPGKDFTSWDLPRLFAEIDKHFQAALSDPKELRKTPVSAWDALLVKGTMPDSYRPTLYDFIAWEALEFYTSGEQAAARPQDAFEAAAGSPALKGPDQFQTWKPWTETADTNAAGLRAIRIYQDLMRFHQSAGSSGSPADPQPLQAFGHVDLERLSWAWNTSFGEDKNGRYKAALETFVLRNADDEISALAMERHARVLQQEGDFTHARALANRGHELFPKSPGGRLCYNLFAQIEAKSVSIVTERVWNAPWPKITVRYKNFETLYFRAVPYRWDYFVEGRNRRPGQLNEEELADLLKMKPALEWREKLPPTSDYKEHIHAPPAPVTLPKGYYFIIASADPDFRKGDNTIAVADVWISDLALVTRNHDGKVEGFVLQARSGEPVRDAEIEPWGWDQEGRRVRGSILRSDTNGFFVIKGHSARPAWLFRIRDGKDELSTSDDVWANDYSRERGFIGNRTLFFTDRSLYRPGQIIQYKGLALSIDQVQDNYTVNTNREVTVIFQDSNGKEIARQKRNANAYGSFSGSFVAPRDRLMGMMRIFTEGEDGSTMVRVEEYKRPKFEVTLQRPKAAAKLGEKVTITGNASSYTGAAVDGAKVVFRVVRQVRMPWWWGWWRGGGRVGESQEIAHGTLSTKADGSFEIAFDAKPDLRVDPKNEPTFVFEAHADVTDTAGETRSAEQGIRLGYTALEAVMSAGPWQSEEKPVEVKVTAQSLDGEPQITEGSIKIHALVAPHTVQRSPISSAGEDLDGLPDEDLSSTERWTLGAVIFEQGFTTDTNGTAKLSFKLSAGAYRAMLETRDRFGKAVTGLLPLEVVDPAAIRLNIKVPLLVAAPTWDLQPGDEFMALWGTGYDEGHAFIEIERRHEFIQRFWTTPGRTQQQIKLAVTEAMRGGVTLHVTQVRENRIYAKSFGVNVPWKNKELTLRWEHFISKLQPGKKETWTAVITKPLAMINDSRVTPAEALAAEMVATLYDESLDAFTPHVWPANFGIFAQNYSDLQTSFANGPEGFRQIVAKWKVPYESVDISYRSFPPELQERLWGYGWFRGKGVGTRRSLNMPAGGEALYDSMARAEIAVAEGAPAPAAMAVDREAKALTVLSGAPQRMAAADSNIQESGEAGAKIDLTGVTARKNLNETAFFFPHLTADSNGAVRMTFTMPEALTRWKFMGLAHDPQVRHGYFEDHAVTAKDLMVQPNPPRFLREGDVIEFTVKISNQSGLTQAGNVRLTFTDAMTEQSVDKLLGNATTDQKFEVPARESRSYSWRIQVPDGCGFLTYKAVAATDKVSDGEEGAVPVLSRRIFVTESLPLPIRGPATKDFEFTKLLKSGSSKTLRNENLTWDPLESTCRHASLSIL